VALLARRPEHLFYSNGNPLSIYLHSGGRNAVYYDLLGNEEGRLQFIEVNVETPLPGKAIFLARRPLNSILASGRSAGGYTVSLGRVLSNNRIMSLRLVSRPTS